MIPADPAKANPNRSEKPYSPGALYPCFVPYGIRNPLFATTSYDHFSGFFAGEIAPIREIERFVLGVDHRIPHRKDVQD